MPMILWIQALILSFSAGPALANRVIESRVTVVRDVDAIVVASTPVRLNGDRTYDWWVGICFLDGQDIAAIAVASGHALDCRRYSGGRYRDLETPAGRSRIRRAGYC
ncbi:MAG: thermonuclease family protein [Alphaproteobacteria bacterium]|nr:thermonuclease family protein [Alphaproteobacteria bacterium]